MSFNVEISFSGICAFVPNQDQDREVKMLVVLPDGRGRPSAIGSGVELATAFFSKKEIKRHTGYVSFSPADLSGADRSKIADDLTGVWLLDRHRIVLSSSGASNPYKEDVPIADLGEVVPEFGVETSLVGPTPSGVVAQVLIDQGSLEGVESPTSWTFPTSFTGGLPEARAFTHEVILKLNDLEEFALKCTSMDGEPAKDRMWQFHRDSGTVKIVIANLCDDNPLRWPTTKSEVPPDEDFELYYEFLFNAFDKARILGRLKGLRLPIPHPEVDDAAGAGNGQGVNCVPTKTSPVSYNSDDSR